MGSVASRRMQSRTKASNGRGGVCGFNVWLNVLNVLNVEPGRPLGPLFPLSVSVPGLPAHSVHICRRHASKAKQPDWTQRNQLKLLLPLQGDNGTGALGNGYEAVLASSISTLINQPPPDFTFFSRSFPPPSITYLPQILHYCQDSAVDLFEQ